MPEPALDGSSQAEVSIGEFLVLFAEKSTEEICVEDAIKANPAPRAGGGKMG